jgi:hypothetical protein
VSKPHDTEAVIQDRIRRALASAGFTICDKSHGNMYQQGWPDLYAFHPHRGHKWIEVKTPTGSLTPAQRARFACWHVAGVQVHVLCNTDLSIIYQPGNWHEWLTGPQREHFERRRAVLAPGGIYVTTNWEDWL